VQDMWYI